jgi:DNA (cytosine-5)-methyltransferase 1
LLKLADIYCGASGMSSGFKAATAAWSEGAEDEGFEIVYGVDRDKNAIETFRRLHFQGLPQERLEVVAPCKNIDEITAQSILDAIKPHSNVDILIGGPSCQGVSTAGLRNPGDHRNDMLLKFISLVRELQASWFAMENVSGLTHQNNRGLLAEIFKELESIPGYVVSGDVLLAADYGVPQFRYRLFIIGTNTGAPIRFPSATHTPEPPTGQYQLMQRTQSYRTVRDAISDLVRRTPKVYEEDASPYEGEESNLVPHNHYCVEIGETNKARIAKVRPGQDWRDMPVRLLPERYYMTRASDQKGTYGRLLWDWPAYTITSQVTNVTAGPFTHPDFDRMLSVREAARLQSFPDDHVFYGSVGSQYRQVGNAVPPQLAKAIANSILFCHYRREEAMRWGRPGRLSYQLIQEAVDGKANFPTLTPRHVAPCADRRAERKKVQRSKRNGDAKGRKSAWNSRPRPSDPHPYDTKRLRRLAEQPSNYRAAKRAKAIVSFIDKVPRSKIVKEANVSEASVRKWVNSYYENGIDGRRAYHSSFDTNDELGPKLANQIKRATQRVRKTLLAPTKSGIRGAKSPKRLHMNRYLLDLIECFGDRSVNELILAVEEKLGTGIGTVYVGDLLALCNVVLRKDGSNADGAMKIKEAIVATRRTNTETTVRLS